MKNILIIGFIALISFSKNAKAQAGVPDTLAYLQTIVANKTQYIGQPFSVLYDNLQIQIKFFTPFGAIHYDKNKETSTSYAFYYPHTTDDHYLSYPRLEIYWQTPLDANQSSLLWKNNNFGEWSAAIYTFYKDAIITDVKVFDID